MHCKLPLFGGVSRDCGPEFLGVQRGQNLSGFETKGNLHQLQHQATINKRWPTQVVFQMHNQDLFWFYQVQGGKIQKCFNKKKKKKLFYKKFLNKIKNFKKYIKKK